MADLTKDDIQLLLDAQSRRLQQSLDVQSERLEKHLETRTKEIVTDVVTEVVTDVVNDAIEQVVMPVLNDMMKTQNEHTQLLTDHTERLERIEGPHKQQEVRLDVHDHRIAALEAKTS